MVMKVLWLPMCSMSLRYATNPLQHLFYPFQGIDHCIVDTSQQGQLFSTDKEILTPIVEEEEGVETSSPDVVVTSPNQPSKTHDEG